MHSVTVKADPITKVGQVVHTDHDGMVYFENTQDVEALRELNRARFNSVDQRARWGPEPMHLVGSIPLVLYAELEREGRTQDPEDLKRWLMDPENSAWLTRPGRL